MCPSWGQQNFLYVQRNPHSKKRCETPNNEVKNYFSKIYFSNECINRNDIDSNKKERFGDNVKECGKRGSDIDDNKSDERGDINNDKGGVIANINSERRCVIESDLGSESKRRCDFVNLESDERVDIINNSDKKGGDSRANKATLLSNTSSNGR